jgi:hypothetical protein
MKPYREEGRFIVRLDLSAEFGDDYEGDDDGYAWLERWRERVRPQVVRAVFDALRKDPAFEVVAAPRGVSPDEEVDISVRWKKAEGVSP